MLNQLGIGNRLQLRDGFQRRTQHIKAIVEALALGGVVVIIEVERNVVIETLQKIVFKISCRRTIFLNTELVDS